MARNSDSGIFDREIVDAGEWRTFLREVRRAGGKVTRSAPVTHNGGQPAYSVTVFYA